MCSFLTGAFVVVLYYYMLTGPHEPFWFFVATALSVLSKHQIQIHLAFIRKALQHKELMLPGVFLDLVSSYTPEEDSLFSAP